MKFILRVLVIATVFNLVNFGLNMEAYDFKITGLTGLFFGIVISLIFKPKLIFKKD